MPVAKITSQSRAKLQLVTFTIGLKANGDCLPCPSTMFFLRSFACRTKLNYTLLQTAAVCK